MKSMTLFYLRSCPYCKSAFQAIEELKDANPDYEKVEMTLIEEHDQPEIADSYDYWNVPTVYVGEEKIYEAYFGHRYDTIKENIKRAFDMALEA